MMVDLTSERDLTLAAGTTIRFSVVVLTYARDEMLGRTLETLAETAGARTDYEVILVDNNVDDVDRTGQIARFAHHQLVRTGANKGVSARNDGMAVARGEIIVLLDDDVFVKTQGFLGVFAAAFDAHPDVGVLNVRKLDSATLTLLPECVPHTDKGMDMDKPFFTFRFIGGLVAVRRTVFETLGGYSTDFFYGEEERDWSYRIIKAGWKIYYEPGVTAVETNHSGGRSPRERLRTQILGNRYIISFLHRPTLVMLYDSIFFTAKMWLHERGRLDVLGALRLFTAWLRKPDRRRRAPIDGKTQAYIRACGGTIWR